MFLAVNRAGTIAGAVIGTLLALSLLAFFVFCCCKKQREKKYEKEVHHDIRCVILNVFFLSKCKRLELHMMCKKSLNIIKMNTVARHLHLKFLRTHV